MKQPLHKRREPYAKLFASWHSHPRTGPLSLAAGGLEARMLSWSVCHGTDGRVPKACVQTAAGPAPKREVARALAELLAAGVITDDGAGAYLIRDFLQANISKEDDEARRIGANERQSRKRSRERTAPVTRDSDVIGDVGHAPVTAVSLDHDHDHDHEDPVEGDLEQVAPARAAPDPDHAPPPEDRVYPAQVARLAWSRAIEANGGIGMDGRGAEAHAELAAIEEAAERVVVKRAAPATLIASERRRRRDELVQSWADGWVAARYARAKAAGEGPPRLRVAWWAESCAEAAAAGGTMPGVAKSRGMRIGREPIAARDAQARLAALTADAGDALEGVGE